MALQGYQYIKTAIVRKFGLRVRCPVCGMWAHLPNVKRDHVLYQELRTYSRGRARIENIAVLNEENLKPFWIKRLQEVLIRMGWRIERDVPYELEREDEPGEPKIKEVAYFYAKEGKEIPYHFNR